MKKLPAGKSGRAPRPSLRGEGYTFVVYGDCCSGVPGGAFERNFAAVNARIRQLSRKPDFIIFLGDHIAGATENETELRKQWRYWLDSEMSWARGTPLFHVTSNHDTYSTMSERVWRDIFPGIPRNGPPGQEGLSYWVRRGGLLLVCVNTSFSGLGGNGHVENKWLESVLSDNSDARLKLVAGHYPAFPVNSYGDRPLWCIVEDEARSFWSVLVRHGVAAYLCSHVIAFDQQQHDGVLQVCSGGAGTNYGLGGFMGEGEYLHFVSATVGGSTLRLEAVDTGGLVRERFSVRLHGR